jgi:hypothetical protein
MVGNAIGASIGFYYESIGVFVTMAIIIIVLMISMGLTSLAMFNIIDIDILGDDQEYSLGMMLLYFCVMVFYFVRI